MNDYNIDDMKNMIMWRFENNIHFLTKNYAVTDTAQQNKLKKETNKYRNLCNYCTNFFIPKYII